MKKNVFFFAMIPDLFLFFGALLLLVFTSGCTTEKASEIDAAHGPRFVLAFYPAVTYPTGADDEDVVRAQNDDVSYWIKAKPRFHSREILAITPLPIERKPGYYNLRLKLSKNGGRWWDNMIDYCYGDRIIVALDDYYLTDFKAYFTSEETYAEEDISTISTGTSEYVTLIGPFREELAERICAYAAFNYQWYKKHAEEEQKAAEEAANVDPYEEAVKQEAAERERRRKELNKPADFNPFSIF